MKNLMNFSTQIILAVFFSNAIWAQTSNLVRFNISPESKLWFDGTSTIHDYRCDAGKIEGFMEMDLNLLSKIQFDSTDGIVGGKISISVLDLKSEKEKLNEKMYKSLKQNQYSEITFELINASFNATPDSTDTWWVKLQTSGKLKVAGFEKMIDMEVTAYRENDGKLRFEGKKSLLMKDFGIKPPSMMLGILKTANGISVHFDLVLVPQKSQFKTQITDFMPSGISSALLNKRCQYVF